MNKYSYMKLVGILFVLLIATASVASAATEAPDEVPVDKEFVPMVDMVILVDTTGSMGSQDLARIQDHAGNIMKFFNNIGFSCQASVAEYRDFPKTPWGMPNKDFVYNLRLPATSDSRTVLSTIDGLSCYGGYDWQESVNTALVNAMNDGNKNPSYANNYGWRPGAYKMICIYGDAPGHNPEPWIGGYDYAQVDKWATLNNIAILDYTGKAYSEVLDDAKVEDVLDSIMIEYEPVEEVSYDEIYIPAIQNGLLPTAVVIAEKSIA